MLARKEKQRREETFVNTATFGGLDAINAIGKKIIPLPPVAEAQAQGMLNPRAKTAAGKIGEASGNVAGFFYGPNKAAMALGRKVLPNAAKVSGGFGFGARRVQDAVAGALAGALIPGDVQQRFSGALTGAISGPVFGGAVEGVQRAARPIANRLMNSVLKPSNKTLDKRPNLGVEAAEAGLTGSKAQIAKKSQALIDAKEAELSTLLQGAKGDVDVLKIAVNLDDLKRAYVSVGDDAAIKALDTLQETLLSKSSTGKISVQDANQLKRDFYSVLKDSQFGNSDVPAKVKGMKQVAGQLKEGIEGVVPDAKGINRSMGLGIETNKSVGRQLNNEQRNVVLPYLEGGGLAFSLLYDRPEIAALIAARRFAGSPQAKTKTAEILAALARNGNASQSAASKVGGFGRFFNGN